MDIEADSAPSASPTRRALITGSLGLAGAGLLASCGSSHHKGPEAGLSGEQVASTGVAPTAAVTNPSPASLQADGVTYATANSLELLAASVYGQYGPRLTQQDLKTAAARFVDDHNAAAAAFEAKAPDQPGMGQPNEYLETNIVEPLAPTLTNDAAITNLFASVERAIASSYIAAVGTLTDADWRQKFMTYGAASARRAAIYGNGGEGSVPTSATFSMADQIPTKSYLNPTTTTEAEAPS